MGVKPGMCAEMHAYDCMYTNPHLSVQEWRGRESERARARARPARSCNGGLGAVDSARWHMCCCCCASGTNQIIIQKLQPQCKITDAKQFADKQMQHMQTNRCNTKAANTWQQLCKSLIYNRYADPPKPQTLNLNKRGNTGWRCVWFFMEVVFMFSGERVLILESRLRIQYCPTALELSYYSLYCNPFLGCLIGSVKPQKELQWRLQAD